MTARVDFRLWAAGCSDMGTDPQGKNKMLEGFHRIPEAWRKRWWEEFYLPF
jgi:hypothetical protein